MITSRIRRFAGFLLLLILGWLSRASAASFNIQTITPQNSLEGYSPASLRVTFSMTQAGTTQNWTAAVEGNPIPSWVSASPASGTGAGSVTLAFDTASLSPGTYNAALVLTSGSTVSRKTFTLTVQPLNVIKMVPDSSRPWIYALHSSSSSSGGNLSYVFTVSTITGKVTGRLKAGIGATDMTINREENRLYIANPSQSRMEVIDLQTLTSLPAVSSRTDIYRLNAGRAGRLYSEGVNTSSQFILNSATGAQIGAPLYLDWGDAETDPTGRFYYHADRWATSYSTIRRFDVSNDSWASEIKVTSSGEVSGENPLISPNGRRIFWAGGVYDAELKPLRTVGQVVYATTSDGQLAVTEGSILNATSGVVLAPLPVTTTVSAVAGDDSAVYYFDPENRTIGSIPLAPVISPPGPVTAVTPPDEGARLSPLAELKWEYVPMAFGYRIYFGTDASAVAAAGPASPEYAGETWDNAWKLPSEKVPPAERFFWRVDVVGIDGQILTGAVKTFSTLPVTVPVGLSFEGLEGALLVQGAVPTGGVDGATWTASTSGTDWLAVIRASGMKGEAVELEFKPGDLSPGTYTGNVTLTCNGQSDAFPVSLKIKPLKLTRLKADPARPRLYGIHAEDLQSASLVSVRTGDGRIERVMPLSSNPTGMDITPDNRFLYVITQGGRQLHRIDLEDWSMVVQPLPPAELGESRRLLVAAVGGTRLCWSDGLSPSRLHLMDFATGVELTAPVNQGGVAGMGRTADGSRLVVYSANGQIWLMDTLSLKPVLGPLAGSPPYDLEAPVTARPDDSVFFAGNRKFRFADGVMLREYPDSVLAATDIEGILFGYAGAWREASLKIVWSRQQITETQVRCAVAGDQSAFFWFDTAASKLISMPINVFGDVPGPQPEDGGVVTSMPGSLSWTPNPAALRYEVYFGQDMAAVDTAVDPSSPTHLASTENASLPFGQPFTTGGIWWWRVDTVLAGTILKGKVWKFTGGLEYLNTFMFVGGGYGYKEPAVALEGATLLVGSAPKPSDVLTAARGMVMAYEKSAGREEWRRVEVIQNQAGPAVDEFGSSVALKGETAWIGVPQGKTGGRALEYRRDAGTRRWMPTGRSVGPADPTNGGGFGSSLVFNGSLLAVASPFAKVGLWTSAGSLEIFDASTLTRLAVIPNPAPVNDSAYGLTMALGGDDLVVGVPYRSIGIDTGDWKGYYGDVDVWARSGDGSWARKVTIPPPVPAEGAYFGKSLAMADGTFFAGTASLVKGGTVYPFEKQPGGNWNALPSLEAAVDAAVDAPVSSLAAAGDFLVTGVQGSASANRGYASNVWLHRRISGQGWIPVAPALPPLQAQLAGMGTKVGITNRYLVSVNEGNYASRLGVSIFLHNPAANLDPVITSAPNPLAVGGQAYKSPISARDDNPGDILAFSTSSPLPSWLTLEDQGDGTALLSGTPPVDSPDVAGVSIRVDDGHGGLVIVPFELTIIPSGDLPVLTALSADQTVNDGESVEIKATVAPMGGLITWQWYRDDVPLPGRTQSSLAIRHAQVSDSGTYHVRITRNGRWVDSGPTHLTVNQAANRFGGDWPTFGAGNSRSAACTAMLGRHVFVPAWTAVGAGLNPVTVAEGRVYASSGNSQDDPRVVTAFDLETGAPLWSHSLPRSYSLNSPTFHAERLYLLRSGYNYFDSAELICLEAMSGNPVWNYPFYGTGGRYPAVAVTDEAIYAAGGGVTGYDLNGRELFFSSSVSSQICPLVHEGKLFVYGGGLKMLDKNGGWPVSSMSPFAESPFEAVTMTAEGNRLIMVQGFAMRAVDLDQWKVAWSREDSFNGMAAVGGGMVYAIRNRDVQSYDAAAGTPGLSYPIPEGTTVGYALNVYQPVVLEDTLIVPTYDSTYIFDLQSGKRLQKLAGGGPVTYSDGVLLASGQDQTLRAWRVNQPSVLTPQDALLSASPGVPVEWSLTVSDPDGDIPAIRTEEMPEWLRMSGPSAEGTVRFSGTPSADSLGAFVFTVTADDGKSFPATLEMRGIVGTPGDAPAVTASGLPAWNPVTGLWEQTVTVKNPGTQDMSGFEIEVTGLSGQSRLYNGSGSAFGHAWVTNHQSLGAGASVTLVLEYWAPPEVATLNPGLTVSVVVPEPDSGENFKIGRAEMSAPGVFLLEFNTVPGELYGVQYSSSGGVWTDSIPRVRAAGSRIQWLDEGAPFTGSVPGGDRSRFYRVRHLTNP